MRKILSLILAAVFSLTACSEAGGKPRVCCGARAGGNSEQLWRGN